MAINSKLPNPPVRKLPFVTSSIQAGPQNIALDSSGYAWCWGYNTSGSLGNNTNSGNVSSPVSVVGGKRFIAAVNGAINNIVFALDMSSYAWGWGANGSVTLGDGTAAAKSSPVSVVGGRQWSKLANRCGITMSALDLSSYAWCWGDNTYGECGDNAGGTARSSPVSVVGGKQWILISTGSPNGANPGHTVALDSLSYAWAWGWNNWGQLGNNTTANASSPVSVVGGKQWIDISVGGAHATVGLDSLSYAWCWGASSNGQLGTSSLVHRSSPVSVVGGKQWFKVSMGSSAVAALDSNSYAWCWGTNGNGECGDNTLAGRSSPVSVVGGRQFFWIDLGGNICFAIGTSGPFAWGHNGGGQFADWSTTYRSSPVSAGFVGNAPIRVFK